MHTVEWMQNWKRPVIEHMKMTPWFWVVAHPENLMILSFVDIGAFTYIQAEEGVELHEEVEIGSHCSIYSVSTIDGTRGKVVVENGACIGSHSTIMPGVTIGTNATVAAHSFVTKDVPANEVHGGTPARYLIMK
jgi:acetyltransferase-like isoleucine patch superfamily enzyme